MRGISDRPGIDDASRNAPGIALLTILIDHTGQILLGPVIDDIICRESLSRIHPHVERTRLSKRESTSSIVQLEGRYPQVHQYPVTAVKAALCGDPLKLTMPALYERHAASLSAQIALCDGQRRRISVNGQ